MTSDIICATLSDAAEGWIFRVCVFAVVRSGNYYLFETDSEEEDEDKREEEEKKEAELTEKSASQVSLHDCEPELCIAGEHIG